LIQVIPVPGKTVRTLGINELFLMWIVVIFVEGVIEGVGETIVVTTVVSGTVVTVANVVAGIVVCSVVVGTVGVSMVRTSVGTVVAGAEGLVV